MSPHFIKSSSAFFWTPQQQWFISYFQDHAPASKNKIGGGNSKIKLFTAKGLRLENHFSLNRIHKKKKNSSSMLSKISVPSSFYVFFFLNCCRSFLSLKFEGNLTSYTFSDISICSTIWFEWQIFTRQHIILNFHYFTFKRRKNKLFRSHWHKTADPWHFQGMFSRLGQIPQNDLCETGYIGT